MRTADKISIFGFFVKAKSLLILATLPFVFFSLSDAQDLPKEIRGYKVHRADISVKNAAEKTDRTKSKSEAFVKVGELKLSGVTFGGIAFEISAEIDSIEQSGTVDFLTFHDFRVNDLKVEIEEYRESFDFKKNQSIVLPEPIEITVGAIQGLRGALGEVSDSKEEWTITGRIFVFGEFKKAGMKFKRVVPVEINLKIKNPLKLQ